jgi:beta-galactosidase GanA
MLEAVRKAILMKAEEFKKSPHYNDYKMLAMQWELTYQNYDEASLRKWQEWLSRRYGTIEELNTVWKTDLTDFADVTLPPVQWNAEENPAKFYDFGEFNLWRFTDYLLWARNVIAEQLPGWHTTTGGGQPFGSGFAHDAVDEEYLRVNGVVDVFLSETGSRSWGTAVFMDLQHSIDPNTMIQDPEYHATGGLMPLMFFHGAAVIDFYDWVGAGVNALLPHGYATLRGTLDARRLGECIVQFPKAAPQAALLYSRASLIQRFPGTTGNRGVDTPYTLELQKCYRAGTLLDTPMGFITTRQVNMGIGDGLKVIIVPGAYFANADEAAKVLSFAEAGGTVVVMPTSFVADEYNRRRRYLDEVGIEIVKEEVPQYLAAKARAGVSMPGSEYDFIQGPIAETVVSEEPTATLTWTASGTKAADTLAGRGIRQTVKVTGDHQVLATYEDGSPAVLAKPHGRGQVIYVAMQLEEGSIGDLLDWVYDRAGVERLVRVKSPEGGRVPGLESRTVRSGEGCLTYLYNMSERTVTASLHPTVKVGSIQDLTYARTLEPSATLEVGPYDFYILKLLP